MCLRAPPNESEKRDRVSVEHMMRIFPPVEFYLLVKYPMIYWTFIDISMWFIWFMSWLACVGVLCGFWFFIVATIFFYFIPPFSLAAPACSQMALIHGTNCKLTNARHKKTVHRKRLTHQKIRAWYGDCMFSINRLKVFAWHTNRRNVQNLWT